MALKDGPEPYYQDEFVTVFNGDAREILPYVEGDLILTDPDYGVGRRYGAGRLRTREEFVETVGWLVGQGLPTVIHMPQSLIREIPRAQWLGCWFKPGQIGGWMFSAPVYPHWEPIAFYNLPVTLRRRSDVFVADSAKPNGHPTPKPVSLAIQLLDWLPGGVVIDPFAGSGTTLRAAKDLGRRAIGIELEERYCDLIVKRCGQEVMEFVS